MSDDSGHATKRHLGVGMRLAIVASVLWMIGGSLWIYYVAQTDSMNAYGSAVRLCYSYESPFTLDKACQAAASAIATEATHTNMVWTIPVAAGVLAVAWLILGGGGWLALKVGRWVAAGRRQGNEV